MDQNTLSSRWRHEIACKKSCSVLLIFIQFYVFINFSFSVETNFNQCFNTLRPLSFCSCILLSNPFISKALHISNGRLTLLFILTTVCHSGEIFKFMAFCLVFVNTNNGYPLLIRSTNILERNEHSPEMILNLLARPSDNQIPLALIGILTTSYTFSTKFGIKLSSCHTDDCIIHFYEYNDHLLMCLLEPTEYDIPNECTQYKIVLLKTLFNMIIGYEYIDRISQTNPQRLQYDFNLVKYYVDTILNDEQTFSFGDLTQCTDRPCGFDSR